MRGMRPMIGVLVIISGVFGSQPLHADVPHLVHYQGHVVDQNNAPLEGNYTLTFALYPAATGGTAVWQEVHTSVPVTGGNFEVFLGAGSPTPTALDVDWTQGLWLSVKVGTDSELLPRQRIGSVPLALVAEELAEPVSTSNITDDANKLVPSGAIILWDSTSCPAGYSRVSALDGKFLVSNSIYDAAAGGSNAKDLRHVHSGIQHAHSLSDVANSQGWNAGRGNGSGTDSLDAAMKGQVNSMTAEQNASDTTGNPTTDMSTVDIRPAYATILLCKKN